MNENVNVNVIGFKYTLFHHLTLWLWRVSSADKAGVQVTGSSPCATLTFLLLFATVPDPATPRQHLPAAQPTCPDLLRYPDTDAE